MKKAVDNISFTVNKGEIFAFIEHNGAGKTTTSKSIVGILDFEEGDILINGKSIKKDPFACKMQMAYVPDNPDILVMDEPFVRLDPKAVFDMKEIMKKMCKEGKTILFSTHILDLLFQCIEESANREIVI